jgi:hypothetical protein
MEQLALRLKALRFIVCRVTHLAADEVTLIGIIYVRRASLLAGNKSDLAYRALKDHGFSLYIQSVI